MDITGVVNMLVNYKVKGFKSFNNKIEFSLKANNYISKNSDHVIKTSSYNILKSAIIYGPNNTGKSVFVESFKILKKIIKEGKLDDDLINYTYYYNFFYEDKDKGIEYDIDFLDNDVLYNYKIAFKYKFGITDEILTVNNNLIFDRNKENNSDLNDFIISLKEYKNKLIVSTLLGEYKKYTDGINNFFDKIIILDDSKSYDLRDVIDFYSNAEDTLKKKFKNIIQKADISIESIDIPKEYENYPDNLKLLKLQSTYKMNGITKREPSFLTDSIGTKKLMNFACHMIQALVENKILIVDEIDNSLHTSITKNIFALFNNEDNKFGQLIATAHDLLLLDNTNLFRKDQVWFTYKDNNEVFFYSLNEFKDNDEKSARNNVMISYLKGIYGALPYPDFQDVISDE
jgi:AAA15 family ATPase/GTPase